jgi:2-C-methyl-D-erythritol 4-phosphate cytidylyltransferase
MKDSIRKIFAGGSRRLNRNNYLMVQTPQTFDLALIKQAYSTVEQDSFTDDASVWEAAGHQVNLVDGSEKNLKITTIHDLMIAEILMDLK